MQITSPLQEWPTEGNCGQLIPAKIPQRSGARAIELLLLEHGDPALLLYSGSINPLLLNSPGMPNVTAVKEFKAVIFSTARQFGNALGRVMLNFADDDGKILDKPID